MFFTTTGTYYINSAATSRQSNTKVDHLRIPRTEKNTRREMFAEAIFRVHHKVPK